MCKSDESLPNFKALIYNVLTLLLKCAVIPIISNICVRLHTTTKLSNVQYSLQLQCQKLVAVQFSNVLRVSSSYSPRNFDSMV